MQILTYLFILALALGAACSNDSKKREVPPPTEAPDTSREETVNSQTNKSVAGSQLREVLSEGLDTLFLISGTEPFWGLTIARPYSVYTSADGDTLLLDFKEARQASARPDGFVQVFDLGQGQQLVLRKAGDCPCSDGMSDRAYPYQATLNFSRKNSGRLWPNQIKG